MTQNKLKLLILSIFILNIKSIYTNLSNFTSNDPFPLYSSVYPYSFLSAKQKYGLSHFEYAYPVHKFRFSVSGFRQSANFGRDQARNAVNLGDLPNGRWNMFGPFYDPILANQLFTELGINQTPPPPSTGENQIPSARCFDLITNPSLSDPNQEFGFFTIPMLYRKYGARFEGELLLVDKCFYNIGVKFQFGVADLRQTVIDFSDLTCQALGIACPASNETINSSTTMPVPVDQKGVTPPFIETQVPCPDDNACTTIGPTTEIDCPPLVQKFTPCDDQTVCFSFDGPCKKFVIDNITNKRKTITNFLGLDTDNFNSLSVEDLRLGLFYRHIFEINQEDEFYPRFLIMPFIEAIVGIPLDKEKNPSKLFALSAGNDNHPSAGVVGGLTIDFLDTIDLSFVAGFTKFFERDISNFRLPTNVKESGIFPYTADIKRTPGTTWHFGAGFNAYHFLDNLSVWFEWVHVSHREDKIKVCRSFIPSTSIYFKQGFLVDHFEADTKWEVHMFNTGLNYDLSENISAGVLWQAPVKQRNAYRSGTVLGTVTFVY